MQAAFWADTLIEKQKKEKSRGKTNREGKGTGKDLDDFIATLRLAKRAKKTIYDYTLIVSRFFDYCKKDSAKDVTPEDMRGFLVKQITNLKNNTYFIYVARLKTFFKDYNPAITDWIKKNVKVSLEDTDVEALSKQQLYDLARALSAPTRTWRFGDTWETVHWFLSAIGCRVGEACQLNMGDLAKDLKEGVYHIHFRAEITKTRKPRDTYLKMTSIAGIALGKYLEKHRHGAKLDEPLFLNAYNHRFSPARVEAKYRQVRRKLGITVKCTPHVLRHTYCTFLQEHDVDPKVASSMTGHSVVTYLKKYGHPTKKRKKDIAKTYQIV